MRRPALLLGSLCLAAVGLSGLNGCTPLSTLKPAPTPTLMARATLPTLTPPPTTSPPPPDVPAGLAPAKTAAAEPMQSAWDLPVSNPNPAPTPGLDASEAELMYAPPIPSAAEILEWRPPPVPVPYALHPNDHYWLRRPIPSGQVDWGLDSYPYGGNGSGLWKVHHGMDFPNDPGTPVLAAGDGVVVWASENWSPLYVAVSSPVADTLAASDSLAVGVGGASEAADESGGTTTTLNQTWRLLEPYGNYIIIEHDWGYEGEPVYTLYGHLLELFVQKGDHVSAGDLIAGVGNTGNSTGPHLHFEVRVGENDYGSTRNPALWMAPYEGWGTLAGRVTTADGTLLYGALVAVYPMDNSGNWDVNSVNARYLTSYASSQLNPDDRWQENFVVPDLPAGSYHVRTWAGGEILEANIAIQPGVTTYIKLHTGGAPADAPAAQAN